MASWYVVHTQVNKESLAASHLRNQQFDVYLPVYRRRRCHAGRTDYVLRPLFPRYLFVRLGSEPMRWRSVNGTRGVTHIIRHGDCPATVPDEVIEDIRAREDTAGTVILDPAALAPGARVHLAAGPFAGYDALFQNVADEERVNLLLQILGRQVPVTVQRTHLSVDA